MIVGDCGDYVVEVVGVVNEVLEVVGNRREVGYEFVSSKVISIVEIVDGV